MLRLAASALLLRLKQFRCVASTVAHAGALLSVSGVGKSDDPDVGAFAALLSEQDGDVYAKEEKVSGLGLGERSADSYVGFRHTNVLGRTTLQRGCSCDCCRAGTVGQLLSLGALEAAGWFDSTRGRSKISFVKVSSVSVRLGPSPLRPTRPIKSS